MYANQGGQQFYVQQQPQYVYAPVAAPQQQQQQQPVYPQMAQYGMMAMPGYMTSQSTLRRGPAQRRPHRGQKGKKKSKKSKKSSGSGCCGLFAIINCRSFAFCLCQVACLCCCCLAIAAVILSAGAGVGIYRFATSIEHAPLTEYTFMSGATYDLAIDVPYAKVEVTKDATLTNQVKISVDRVAATYNGAITMDTKFDSVDVGTTQTSNAVTCTLDNSISTLITTAPRFIVTVAVPTSGVDLSIALNAHYVAWLTVDDVTIKSLDVTGKLFQDRTVFTALQTKNAIIGTQFTSKALASFVTADIVSLPGSIDALASIFQGTSLSGGVAPGLTIKSVAGVTLLDGIAQVIAVDSPVHVTYVNIPSTYEGSLKAKYTVGYVKEGVTGSTSTTATWNEYEGTVGAASNDVFSVDSVVGATFLN